MGYGNYSLNNAASDPNTLGDLIDIRCGKDAPAMRNIIFGSSTFTLSGQSTQAKSLMSSGSIDSSNAITPENHLLLTQKYAALTQIATQNHVIQPQTEDSVNDTKITRTPVVAPTTIETNLHDVTKPVSPFIGSTLGTLTGASRGATGSGIPSIVHTFLERTDTKSAIGLGAAYQSVKIDEMSKLPSSVMGSIGAITNTAGTLLNDVYAGTQAAIQITNRLKTNLIVLVEKTAFAALDTFIPSSVMISFGNFNISLSVSLDGLLEKNLNKLTSSEKFNNAFDSATKQITDVLKTPQKLIQQFIVPHLNAGQSRLHNPTAAFDKLLPPDIHASINIAANSSNVGLGGDGGGSLFTKLETSLKGTVVDGIMKNYSLHINLMPHMFKSGKPIQPSTFSIGYRQSSYPTSTTFNGEVYRQPDYIPTPILY